MGVLTELRPKEFLYLLEALSIGGLASVVEFSLDRVASSGCELNKA